MNNNVIGLKGLAPFAQPGEPVENVVARCRELLGKAERGELRGLIAICYEAPPGKPRFFWSHDNTDVVWNGLSTALLAATFQWANDGFVDIIGGVSDEPPKAG